MGCYNYVGHHQLVSRSLKTTAADILINYECSIPGVYFHLALSGIAECYYK